jgi:hypothetical protein
VKRAKLALLPVFVSLIALGVSACGSSGKSTTTGSSTAAAHTTQATKPDPAHIPPAPVETKVDADHDNDVGAPYDDSSNAGALEFGKPASTADTRAITAAIKHYYAVALSGNGAKGCSLIYSPIAESVVEDYGQSPPGPAYMSANTCAGAMTLFFKHFHPQFVAEVPHLRVRRVQLEEHHGIAILSFGKKLSERDISIVREGHAWKIEGLLDKELP